ncbi:hypothetical protein BVY04_02375 [bacterium M21]|nr:hypothetical protein BVY04_02375 [bacterium M21]
MLKLSTKARYASRIMVRLAMTSQNGPVRRHDIAKAEGLTPDYVEQILIKLKTAGLATSHRGAKGGYTMGKAPEQITMAMIVEATDGPICLAPCVKEHCDRESMCVTQTVWKEASKAAQDVLDKAMLSDLVADMHKLNKGPALTFDI